MDGGGFDAVALQLAGEFVAIFFHAQEHQHLRHIACADQVGEQRAFALGSDLIDLVRHQIGGGVAARDFNRQRIAQHLVGEALDLVGKRRRKQQALALGRNQRDDAFQVGQKAHVEHTVGLVEHEYLHLAEVDGFLLDVIEQPPRRGDENFHAGHQCGLLRFHVHAAVDHGGAQRQMLAIALHRFVHLRCEFARRGENQRPHRMARGRRAAAGHRCEHLQQRQREAGRLAGAGLRATHKIASGQHGRNRLHLDRGCFGVALVCNGALQFGNQIECCEGHQCGVRLDICGSLAILSVRSTVESKDAAVAGRRVLFIVREGYEFTVSQYSAMQQILPSRVE